MNFIASLRRLPLTVAAAGTVDVTKVDGSDSDDFAVWVLAPAVWGVA